MNQRICVHDQQPRSVEHHLIQANKALLDVLHFIEDPEVDKDTTAGAVLFALDELGSLAEWTGTIGFQDEHHTHP